MMYIPKVLSNILKNIFEYCNKITIGTLFKYPISSKMEYQMSINYP